MVSMVHNKKTPQELEIEITAGEIQRYQQQKLRAIVDLKLSQELLAKVKDSKKEEDLKLIKELKANIEAAERDIKDYKHKVIILIQIYNELD